MADVLSDAEVAAIVCDARMAQEQYVGSNHWTALQAQVVGLDVPRLAASHAALRAALTELTAALLAPGGVRSDGEDWAASTRLAAALERARDLGIAPFAAGAE